MSTPWTFGQKIAAGFTLLVVLTIAIGGIAVYSLSNVVAAKDVVINLHAQNIADAERMALSSARRVAATRAYLLSKGEDHLVEARERRRDFQGLLGRLREAVRDGEGRRLLDDIADAEGTFHESSERVTALRATDAPLEGVVRRFEDEVVPRRAMMTRANDAFITWAERTMQQEREAASQTARLATSIVLVFIVIVVLLAIGAAAVITRGLTRQIGSSVAQVRSSSAELQAAANQQATATKEQATAMSEISTTITELLATSRQIAESAQRVAQIAGQTAAAAHAGDGTVLHAHESIGAIRRQVDLIVTNMLELGRKSQEIGTVLDIVAELAEQTNILAINATIEAAGAGDAGKRFAVVADEIRKLADRVTGSTKEIRTLIEDVRSSVNTTVMTTETGSKAVDAGALRFSEVAAAFKQIGSQVVTTTEAAREIELSTKQQATAVEQVNVAITNVAQATKETEASSGQTLQTARELGAMSQDLLRMIQPDSAVAARGA